MTTDPHYVAEQTGVVVDAVVTHAPLSLADARPLVLTPAMGALVTFEGVVRDHDGGRAGVESLRYTSHPTAQEVIARVAASVVAEHPDVRLYVAHRLGELAVGDLAFVVLAAAAHRGAAFAAASLAADRVKAEVPIWKEQSHTDGSQTWVGLE